MITTSVIFDRRGKSKNGGEGQLEVRIIVNRKPIYINTGVRVRANQWQFDKIVNHPNANQLNERLGFIVGKVMDEVNERMKDGREISAAILRSSVWQKQQQQESNTDFIDWVKAEILRLDVEYGTFKRYRTLVNRLNEWGCMMTWEDVTADNIIAFDVWLRRRISRSLHLSEAGRHNYHRTLRHMLYRAEALSKINANPYAKLRGRFKKGDRESTEYLTDEEVEKITKMQPVEGSIMAMARDLFIFQLWTGLSYQDSQAFDFSRYKKVDGQYRLTAKRIKTGEPYVSQLLPPAVEVLKKYGMSTPKIINAVYNRELHAIGLACGISTRLHSHLARHTFATYMLRHGVKLENVSRMLGHTNIKQTLRYAKVLAEDVHSDFEKINEILTSKN